MYCRFIIEGVSKDITFIIDYDKLSYISDRLISILSSNIGKQITNSDLLIQLVDTEFVLKCDEDRLYAVNSAQVKSIVNPHIIIKFKNKSFTQYYIAFVDKYRIKWIHMNIVNFLRFCSNSNNLRYMLRFRENHIPEYINFFNLVENAIKLEKNNEILENKKLTELNSREIKQWKYKYNLVKDQLDNDSRYYKNELMKYQVLNYRSILDNKTLENKVKHLNQIILYQELFKIVNERNSIKFEKDKNMKVLLSSLKEYFEKKDYEMI